MDKLIAPAAPTYSLTNLCLAFVLCAAVIMLPEMAFADQQIGGVLCKVANWFKGSTGKGIATLAIIVVGVGALMGKVSWGMAIIVGLGVATVFGAPAIVDALGGQGQCSGA